MFEGIGTRGGTRGGKDQFNWSQVKADKYREFYLGQVKYFNSLNSLFLIIKGLQNTANMDSSTTYS